MFYEHLRNERALSGKVVLPADQGHYDGACQRSTCLARPARWFNHSTGHYYCADCAQRLNQEHRETAIPQFGHELCTEGEVVA